MATPVRLEAFFVFSDKLGQTEESELDKVLYYWPHDAAPDLKMNNIGICQGLAGFAATFSAGQPISVIRTEKRRITLYQPDPDLWMAMIFMIPSVPKKAGGELYLDEEVNDSVLQQTVQQAHRMFKLFHGGLQYTLDNFSVRSLRDKLELFFPSYLDRLDVSRLNFFTALDGMNFLPVDKNIYLRIYCFVNHLENVFPHAKHSCFLYDDHLVWSGVEQEDMRVMFRYVAGFLHSEERQPGNVSSPGPSAPLVSARGRQGYVCGPEDVNDPDSPLNTPMIYIGSPLTAHLLVVYQYQRITLLLLLDPGTAVDVKMFKELSEFIDGELKPLVSSISEQFERVKSVKDEFRYVYFNHMNLAMKTSIKRQTPLSSEVLTLIQQIHDDFTKGERDGVKEVYVRHNDGWVVGRRSGQREFYVLFDRKDASLVQVGDDVSRLCDTYFSNIYIE